MVGNWLQGLYGESLFEYKALCRNPFYVVDDDSCLEGLVRLLPRRELPGIEDRSLPHLLKGLSSLWEERRPLWKRFTYATGTKKRELSVPGTLLHSFFTDYLLGFLKERAAHSSCHGAEKGWSPKKSLASHVPFQGVLSFDLKSAFEKMREEFIYGFYFFQLESSRQSFSYDTQRDLAGFLTWISTVRYDDARGLPQGAPHSSYLFNRVLYPLDNALGQAAASRGMRYSRWIDDFTLSSNSTTDFREFVGGLALVNSYFPVARNKSFFQVNKDENGESFGVYLLGHYIQGETLLKNSKEKKDLYKKGSFDFTEWFASGEEYHSWSDAALLSQEQKVKLC